MELATLRAGRAKQDMKLEDLFKSWEAGQEKPRPRASNSTSIGGMQGIQSEPVRNMSAAG
jgi:hypothetical protein